MTKQLEIAASDHGNSPFDEADDHVAERRCLPRFGCDPLAAELNDRDLAIAGPVRPAIDRLHHQAQAATSLRRHARVGGHRSMMQGAPEPGQRLDPAERIGIERDHRGEWICRSSAGKKEKLGLGSAVSVDRVFALLATTRWRRSTECVERSRAQEVGHVRQNEHGRVGAWRPENLLRQR